MRKNKKGVSPLIATVLLIGFAIAIAILVWFWYGNIIKEQAEKTGASTSGKLACASEVKFSIKGSCLNSDDIVLIQVENKGTPIDDFRIALEGSLGTKSYNVGSTTSTTETKELSAPYDNSLIGNLDKVVLTPIITRDNTATLCSDQKQEIKSLKPC